MAEAKETQAAAAEEVQEAGSLLDQIVDEGRFGADAPARDRGRGLIQRFVSELMDGTMQMSSDTETMLNRRIAEIDRLVSDQLNEILHAPEFQQLESTWRGLRYLIDNSETSSQLKIKVFNATKKELARDLRSREYDKSALFEKVYSEEFDQYGGAPFGAILGDYSFGKGPQDMELLGKISNVAAAAHAPFMTSSAADLFGMDSYADIGVPSDLSKIFESTEYARWKAFRETEDSRYVAMCLPRMLLRDVYGKDGVQVEAFDFEEDVDGRDHGKYLWGNAAWALGARVTDSFAKYGWCATIRGEESGGLVTGLPVHNFETDDGDIAMKCPTEAQITDRREKELADLGFVPLVHKKGTTDACFFSVQSAQRPQVYESDSATANARLSSQLPYIFAVSRFAHYLKAMMRRNIGGSKSRSEVEYAMQNWISNYVVGNDDASMKMKAERPLREARVDVEDVPGKPGAYRAVAYLRPHYQLDELTVSMRLVADMPEAQR